MFYSFIAMEDTIQYRTFYLQTANEYLAKLKESLEQLKQNVSDQTAQNNMHIAWHSLKSQSDFMGYKTTAIFCHILELFFNDILRQKKQLTGETVAVVDNAVSILGSDLANIQSSSIEMDLTKEVDSLKTALDINL